MRNVTGVCSIMTTIVIMRRRSKVLHVAFCERVAFRYASHFATPLHFATRRISLRVRIMSRVALCEPCSVLLRSRIMSRVALCEPCSVLLIRKVRPRPILGKVPVAK